METLLKFTVWRERWLRGERSAQSFLLRSSDGRMCCLGFACLAAGYKESDIRDISAPRMIDHDQHTVAADLLLKPRIADAMEINDCLSIDDMERERRLTTVLASLGIEITFADGGMP